MSLKSALYELVDHRNGNIFEETDKVAVHLGDGWCTFPDLDNFDTDKLLKALTLKEKDSSDSIWDPSMPYTESCQPMELSVSALRQLEALFNITQVLFALSRAETVNYTFRDLQLNRHPHSFKKSGFKLLNTDGRVDFYAIFEQVVQNVIDQGGLEVTLLMYKNPMLPMVRQKCLDLISNITTVPDIAQKLMRFQSWFLDHLLIMVRDGDIITDKIPALSVLIRLLKVMLTERMMPSYIKLVDMQYIDFIVDIFENQQFTNSNEYLPFFVKFEFITMQSLTVILGDAEFSNFWSDKAKTRLLNYCMTVLLKAVGACATSQNGYESVNHIYYAEQKSHKHSLAHTIMTVTELLRNDSNMKQFYRYHRPFKQLIVQLYKKYGAKSQYSRLDPGISYALNHLMRVLYINNTKQQQQIEGAVGNPPKSKQTSDTDEKQQAEPRICSNPTCKNEETQFKRFKECSSCAGKVAYCSSKCRKAHFDFHRQNECGRFTDALHKYNRVYDSTSSSSSGNSFNGLKRDVNNSNNVFAKETLGMNDYSELKPLDSYHSLSKTKRLSKFASMNENQRRNSLTLRFSNKNLNNHFDLNSNANNNNNNNNNKNTLAKYTHSMKEIKSNESNGRRLSCLENNEIKKKLMIGNASSKNSNNNHNNESSTIHFMKPLKTSTAVCLTDLTRKQISTCNVQQQQQQQSQSAKQNSDSSSSSSSMTNKSAESNSSAKQQIPTTKKFKTSTGKAKTKARDDQYAHPMNDSGLKRRHSTASAIMTTLTKTTTTTLTKMKTKYCEADSTTSTKSPPTAYKSSQEFFYYGKAQYDFNTHKESHDEEQREANNDRQEDNEDDVDDDEEEDEDFLDSTSSDQTVEKEQDEHNKNENDEDDDEEEEDDDDDDDDDDDEEEEEEIEAKRLAVNENNRVRKFDDYYSSVNSDEPEYNSRYKIVREYEKYTASNTNENVSSTSSTKVQSMSNTNDISSKHQSGLRAPQLSLATLSYNESSNKEANQNTKLSDDENEQDEQTIDNNKNQNTSDEDDEEDDDEDDEDENMYAKGKKHVHLVIDNSIDSHMLTNSYNLKSIQDDLKAKAKSRETKRSSLFKEATVKNAKKVNNKFNELKVFNNLENQSINSVRSDLKSLNTLELPKNSTPIFTDSRATAVLMRNHNHLYNAKLNLTIAPSQHQSQPQTNSTNSTNDERKPTFLLPKVPTCPGKFNSMGSLKPNEQFATSTLKPVSEEVINVNTNNFRIKGSQLNVSQLTSIENVVSTDLVSVSKTPLPKDIRQTFKQEMKRDKIRCLIQ